MSPSPTPTAVGTGAPVSPSAQQHRIDPTVTMLTIVALDKAKVPVARNQGLACWFNENDAIPMPATVSFKMHELKEGRWHRESHRSPHTDQVVTVCGRKIPGQRLMQAQYFVPVHRGPNPEEVERDRLCCRCF